MMIKYSKAALRFLAKADKPTVARIRNAIEGLTHLPPDGDKNSCKVIPTADNGLELVNSGLCSDLPLRMKLK